MSKVKIQGNASGTGVVTLTAPNTNTDRTITLPDSTGSILDSTSTLDATKLSGNLPAIDGSALTGMATPLVAGTDYLAPTGDGSALTGTGKVLQIKTTESTDLANFNSNSWHEANSGYRVSLTPVSSTSTVVITIAFAVSHETHHHTAAFQVYDFSSNSQVSGSATGGGTRPASDAAYRGSYNADNAGAINMTVVDTRTGTSARTYGMRGRSSGNCHINHSHAQRSDPWGWTSTVRMTAIEYEV